MIYECYPFSAEHYAKKHNVKLTDAIKILDQQVSSGELHKRLLPKNIVIYWNNISDSKNRFYPINSHPFESIYENLISTDLMTDEELIKEKSRIQLKVRESWKEIENLRHLSRNQFDIKKEEEIDALVEKWINVSQQLVFDLCKEIKNRGRHIEIENIIQEFRIDNSLIKWNSENKTFY